MPSLKLHLAAIAGIAALSTPAHAEWMDGNQLHDTCSTTAPLDRATCLSYVIGVLDGLRYLSQPPVTPKGATAGQLRDVVAKYLTDHPEKRDQQARTLIRSAVAEAWPELQPKAKAKPKKR